MAAAETLWTSRFAHSLKNNRSHVTHTHFPTLTYIDVEGKPKTLPCTLGRVHTLEPRPSNSKVSLDHSGENIKNPTLQLFSWSEQPLRPRTSHQATSTSVMFDVASCSYFPKTKEQYQMEGLVELFDGSSAIAAQAWREMESSDEMRRLLYLMFPAALGTSLLHSSEGSGVKKAGFDHQSREAPPALAIPHPSSAFKVFSFTPCKVEYLRLGKAQQRISFSYDGAMDGWRLCELNP
ncbi:hypothetical protein CYMTET_24053 [Cymbomonas tetramitiformis]|uniref:Uncharacterized protein n=1 Tax=Cymbomonas tetramitiformis TaxID=36881 RepID=A0AAE0FX99_9CHLO|nr:hypothetical protein CYMTET_24053 [Cymbomonas tetramitiformis]